MKVYVDELPKGATEYGCDNCPYAEVLGINQYILHGEFVSYRDCVCKLDETCGFRLGEKHCPLQSLADHDKQVRKEVCREIWKEFENRLMNKTEDMPVINVAHMINSVLDQKQGETK